MKNFIEYDYKKNGRPEWLLDGLSIWIIASPNSCGSCVIAKSQLEILSRGYPDVRFIYWDVDKVDINILVPDIKIWAYPYVRGYINNSCETAAYSAETYVVEDIIKKLREKSNDSN